MKGQPTKSRSPQRGTHPAIQNATRVLLPVALRGWLLPATAAAVGVAVFVLYNLGVVSEAAAVTTVGVAVLITVLFFGLRSFFHHRYDRVTTAALASFAVLWLSATLYPYGRAINPGTPAFSAELSRGAAAITVPLRERPGRYSLLVEGHFLPTEGRTNRTATYSIAVGHDATTDRVVQGTFSETWGTQRVGAGRRSSLVPSLHQTNQVRDTLAVPGTHSLTLQLTELSPGLRDRVAVRLYSESVPQWALLLLSVFAVAGAILVDAWKPKGVNEGLMTTMTVAVFVGIAIFRVSSTAIPGFPQLVVAILMGTLAGAIGGSLLWRLARPLKQRLAGR